MLRWGLSKLLKYVLTEYNVKIIPVLGTSIPHSSFPEDFFHVTCEKTVDFFVSFFFSIFVCLTKLRINLWRNF